MCAFSATAPGPTPGPAPKRGRPGYDSTQILHVAVTAFNEYGYDATSMGVLAARLGLSKAAIYHHFTSKDEVLRQALHHALVGLEAVLAQDADRPSTAVERLSVVLRGAVLVLVERLPYVTLLLRVRGNTAVERAALERRRDFDRSLTELVIAAQCEGSLRSDQDPAVVTRLLFGMVNSLSEWYRPRGSPDAEALADTVVALALDGVRAR